MGDTNWGRQLIALKGFELCNHFWFYGYPLTATFRHG